MTTAEARQNFVKKYGNMARQVTAGTGIFPETLLAMAITESSSKKNGIYIPGASALSEKANNFFGIKADASWKGNIINVRTAEYDNDGRKYYITDKFRKYSSPAASFRDYVKFLQENNRYKRAGVFTAPDYVTQITRIAAAGYATAPSYGSIVSSIAKQVRSFLPEAKELAGTLAIIAGAIATLLTLNFEDKKNE